MERLAKSLGIENLSRSQVSNMAKELDEQVEVFRNRPLNGNCYPILWVDALYEKVRYDSHVTSMAIQVVCGVNEEGIREVLAIEPMLEESKESYTQLFDKLKERGLQTPSLVISDAHGGVWLLQFKKTFLVLPGNAARSILCGIFLQKYRTKTKKALQLN